MGWYASATPSSNSSLSQLNMDYGEVIIDRVIVTKTNNKKKNRSHVDYKDASPDDSTTTKTCDTNPDDGAIDPERAKSVTHRMRLLTTVAAIGGFLSGYNTGVISGALLPLKRVFSLTAHQEESIVSATIFAAFVASLLGGTVNTYLGRKMSILLAAGIFTLGGAILFSAKSYDYLVFGEIILGVGIGLESLTSPMYISEVAKPSIRGMLVSAYALMMCMGQFFAGIVDGVFGAYEGGWRLMFGMACIPGTIMFLGFLTLPESPSWLMANGREQEAFEIMKTLRDSDEIARYEIKELRDSIKFEFKTAALEGETAASSVFVCFIQMMRDRATRNALIVGCGLMVLQQTCGVNGVLYYAASVYQMSGFGELTSIWLSAFTAFAQILGLGLSVMFVERAGRRVLVIGSFIMVAICSIGLGFAFYIAREASEPVLSHLVDEACSSQPAMVWDGITRNAFDCTSIDGCGFCGNACVVGSSSGPTDPTICPMDSVWEYDVAANKYGWMSVLFMVTYLIVFGIGAAGLPWTINSEIYPVKYRSLAVSISTGTNWLSNLLVSSTFLTVSSPAVLTNYGSFWMYGVLCALGALWLYFVLPETKGLSSDEIEEYFANSNNNGKRRWKQDNATNSNEDTYEKSSLIPLVANTDDHHEQTTTASANNVHYGSTMIDV